MDKAQMDHRWSARQALALPVKLFNDGEAVALGYTHNVGIGGMFVKLQSVKIDKLPENAHVSVAFSVNTEGSTSHHRLPATVIWSGESGAGLMFTDFNVETVHTLRDILYPHATLNTEEHHREH
ncbi:MAG: PilZ domain-containing protein [Gammaproteobacteria bacterium]|nr:PilZ domain-containing protein [Gammaproteobacteria bacterium]